MHQESALEMATTGKEVMTCPRDAIPDSSILRPITFTRKSLSSSETYYSNIKREALVYSMASKRFTTMLCDRGADHYRPQATGIHFQRRHNKTTREMSHDCASL